MRLLFTLILFLINGNVFAQLKDTISYKKSFMVYDYRHADGKRFYRGELNSLLAGKPESRTYFLKYKRGKTVGTVLALGAAAYTIFLSNSQTTLNAQGRVRPVIFTGVLCFWGGVVMMFDSNRQKHKAVKAYNLSL